MLLEELGVKPCSTSSLHGTGRKLDCIQIGVKWVEHFVEPLNNRGRRSCRDAGEDDSDCREGYCFVDAVVRDVNAEIGRESLHHIEDYVTLIQGGQLDHIANRRRDRHRVEREWYANNPRFWNRESFREIALTKEATEIASSRYSYTRRD
jgi:hypothetical protein